MLMPFLPMLCLLLLQTPAEPQATFKGRVVEEDVSMKLKAYCFNANLYYKLQTKEEDMLLDFSESKTPEATWQGLMGKHVEVKGTVRDLNEDKKNEPKYKPCKVLFVQTIKEDKSASKGKMKLDYSILENYMYADQSDDNGRTFRIMTDQAIFDEYFRPVPGLNPGQFEAINMKDYMYICWTFTGNRLYKYEVKSITMKDRWITVDFTSKIEQDNLTYVAKQPFIIRCDRALFDQIDFIENGVRVESLKMSK